jgi:hypothetical protein
MGMRQTRLVPARDRERLAKERAARRNPYIDASYYTRSYAHCQMITGPWSKALLTMAARAGDRSAERTLAQILEAERILWPDRRRRHLSATRGPR